MIIQQNLTGNFLVFCVSFFFELAVCMRSTNLFCFGNDKLFIHG